MIGVDEHKWSHVLGADADGFVTVITDLTDVVAGHGPARLLDMVSGRSAAALTGWLGARDQAFRDGVRIVAMDGFGGYKNAAVEQLPERSRSWTRSTSLLSPGRSSTCAANASSKTPCHRGRSGDPLYGVRRALRTRDQLLTQRQWARIGAVFADEAHAAVETTWCAYQQLIDAYAPPTAARKTLLQPDRHAPRDYQPLDELATLGGPCTVAATTFWPTSPTGLQRPDRGHQRPTRSTTPQRPGLPQPDQLPHPITAALRSPCTLHSGRARFDTHYSCRTAAVGGR